MLSSNTCKKESIKASLLCFVTKQQLSTNNNANNSKQKQMLIYGPFAIRQHNDTSLMLWIVV